jgi:NADH-quinone oxidoreductase subunit C
MIFLVDLQSALEATFTDISCSIAAGELTLTLKPEALLSTCQLLRNDPQFAFEQCVDVCGVDYLCYGAANWDADKANGSGFDRAVELEEMTQSTAWHLPRFAVVYHLLSIKHNVRLRLKVYLADSSCITVASVVSVWASVNWFERETFDLFGILFEGHPDLRRLLTDYGFIGHPFRKDFPLSGHVEVRYDAKAARVVYEPVSIKPRVLVPKVIRTK